MDTKDSGLFCGGCRVISGGESKVINCDYCGNYIISRRLIATEKDLVDNMKCSVMIKRYWERNKKELELNTGNYQDLVNSYDQFSLKDKINNVLRYIGDNSNIGDDAIIFSYEDRYICPAIKKGECQFILDYLVEKKYIKCRKQPGFYLMTVNGWEEYFNGEDLIDPKQCFIAMSFTNKTVESDYKKIISKVLKEFDLKPLVLNDVEHNEDAVMEILYHIKRSAFVIADVRGRKTNVYYEAGYAKGLGREVIWLCPEEQVDKLPFDTRNLNHIVWKTKAELEDKLRKRIMGTVLS